MENVKGMSLVVKNAAAVFFIPALVFGVYVVLHGHLSPGGGFQGGAIIATSIALLLIAFGEKGFGKAFGKKALSALESLALAGFAAIAFLGLGSSFLRNFLANSGYLFGESVSFGVNQGNILTAGTIPLLNMLVGLEVACALSIILISMHSGGDSK